MIAIWALTTAIVWAILAGLYGLGALLTRIAWIRASRGLGR